MTDFAAMDGLDQAKLIRDGEVSAREVVEASINRIEEANPRLNAVISNRFEAALAEAESFSSGTLFGGVPTLLKDLGTPMAGEPNWNGNQLLHDLDIRPSESAALTNAISDAGFVILGRTNVPEFGLVNTTEPQALGPARNPWDLTRSTGGSSGGSAAAVASGMVAIAHASDGGGSIRMPASHCGVYGLKPSWGRISSAPDVIRMENHPTAGFVSRSVRDSAAALDLASGYRPGDPGVAPTFVDNFLGVVAHDPSTLRIGFMDVSEVNGYAVDPEIREITRAAATLLEDLGHQVEVAHPEAMTDPEFLDRWLRLLSPSITAQFEDLERLKGGPLERGDAEEMAWWWREQGGRTTAVQHVVDQVWRDLFRRRLAQWWADGFDVLLSPVLPCAAPPLGFFSGAAGLEASIRILCFTPQFNMSGLPAAAIPFDVTSAGLPVSVQLGGAYGREDVLLQLSAQIERARPWVARLPTNKIFQ